MAKLLSAYMSPSEFKELRRSFDSKLGAGTARFHLARKGGKVAVRKFEFTRKGRAYYAAVRGFEFPFIDIGLMLRGTKPTEFARARSLAMFALPGTGRLARGFGREEYDLPGYRKLQRRAYFRRLKAVGVLTPKVLRSLRAAPSTQGAG